MERLFVLTSSASTFVIFEGGTDGYMHKGIVYYAYHMLRRPSISASIWRAPIRLASMRVLR